MKRSKYWGFVKRSDQAAKEVLRNSMPPLHDVTHRAIGDIPGCTLLPPNDRYIGVFPTAETCAFINSQKNMMKFFDDGERLVYDSQPRQVPVDPPKVDHPITYPPKGFVLHTDETGEHKWVFKP